MILIDGMGIGGAVIMGIGMGLKRLKEKRKRRIRKLRKWKCKFYTL